MVYHRNFIVYHFHTILCSGLASFAFSSEPASQAGAAPPKQPRDSVIGTLRTFRIGGVYIGFSVWFSDHSAARNPRSRRSVSVHHMRQGGGDNAASAKTKTKIKLTQLWKPQTS